MAPGVRQVAQIFEDADAAAATVVTSPKKKHHSRVPSVGDVLRGRRKENSPTKPHGSAVNNDAGNPTPSPLGERHINSPPTPKRVPLKEEGAVSRPQRPQHKKTGSTVSLKDFILGREKEKRNSSDNDSISSAETKTDGQSKIKSSTGLGGFLKKKKSKKDLNESSEQLPDNSSSMKSAESQVQAPSTTPVPTPIWAQFASQPLHHSNGQSEYFTRREMSVEEQIKLYTPRDYSEYRPAEQRNFYNNGDLSFEYKPPQRPFLEHRSSRESIFKEHLEEEQRILSGDFNVKVPLELKDYTQNIVSSPTTIDNASNINHMEKQPRPVSRVLDFLPTFKMSSRSAKHASLNPDAKSDETLSAAELDTAFEKVLDSLNIPHNMRDNMRKLTPGVKAGLMKGERCGSGSSTTSILLESNEVRSSARSTDRAHDIRPDSQDGDKKEKRKSRSRSRPRSGFLSISKRNEVSPTKPEHSEESTRSRSKMRPKSVDLSTPRSSSKPRPASVALSKTANNASDFATMPGDFIHYLREVQKPALVEVGKLHKLRLLLRNESVTWTESFISKGGMDELVQLLYRIMKIEWREEHEDNLLHENLLCLKALCTTSLALQRLKDLADELFPALLGMLFDPERKGPSEFATRAIITSLLFAHLSAGLHEDSDLLEIRARAILDYLKDKTPMEDKLPLDFVSQMHISRPYRTWSKEVVNTTKEVFWIFLHHLNVVPITECHSGAANFAQAHFPPPRPPHPAAPYVGGVEWEATQYLACHLDLVNGILASLQNRQDRNQLREELKQSGWEKVMGGSLRTCNDKFYGGVHEGLKVWVCAAKADGWPVEDVRAGPPRDASPPKRSPVKRKVDQPPQLALDVGVGMSAKIDDGWV